MQVIGQTIIVRTHLHH